MNGGIPSASVSVLQSVRVRTVINDLRPPSLRRLSWESRVPLPDGPSPIVRPLFSRLGPRLSLSPCDKIGPPWSHFPPLPFLPFRLHPDIPRLSSLSLHPSVGGVRDRRILSTWTTAAVRLGPLTRSTSQAFANWPVAEAERERRRARRPPCQPGGGFPLRALAASRRRDGWSLQS